MVPYRTRRASDYEVLMVRLQVAPGPNERAACFMAPVVHEKILMYLHAANLQPVDFTGQRRDVLSKNLMDVAVKTTDRSFYSAVMLVDETTPPLAESPRPVKCKPCKAVIGEGGASRNCLFFLSNGSPGVRPNAQRVTK